MKPKEVKKYKDLADLLWSHAETSTSYILFNDSNHIVIGNQKGGEAPTGKVHLTRREFQKFVDWWEGK